MNGCFCKKRRYSLLKETFYFISSYNADIFIDSLEKMWQTGRRWKVSPKNTVRYRLSMCSTFTVKCVIFHVNRPIINFLKTQLGKTFRSINAKFSCRALTVCLFTFSGGEMNLYRIMKEYYFLTFL